jgi:carboxyl-terminal processing protease
MDKHNNKRRYLLNGFIKVFTTFLILSFSFTSVNASSSPIDEVRYLLKNYYVDEVSNEVLNKPTINEIISALGDPYTQFFNPTAFEDFVDGINNRVSGIGIRVGLDDEGLKVTSVFDNSPAYEAGVKVDDVIVKADGNSLKGLSLDDAVEYVKGEEGSSVNIEVRRGEEILGFKVIRRSFTAPTVEGEIIDNNIAYINVLTFGDSTSTEFDRKLRELERQKPSSYVIDLRDNTGGYLYTALDLAGYFIGNKVALITKDRIDGEVKYYGERHTISIDKPTIFLINEYSASASEVLSGAVKDNKKAVFIGNNTFGKGKVQTMRELSDGGILKFTIQKFFSPLGNTIDKVGIQPDLPVNGKMDALDVSRVLLGKPTSTSDRSGFIQMVIGGRGFAADLSKAREDENWEIYKYILSQVSMNDISIGTTRGWMKASEYDIEQGSRMLYPNYRQLAELENVPVDKKFTVAFSSDVNISSVDTKGIELINADTGERTPLKLELTESKKLVATPEKNLNKGDTYYFVVNPSVKDSVGKSLSEGTVTTVQVAN